MFDSPVTNWLILGTILALLELVMPGTYLIWFGFAALGMSILVYYVSMSLTTQLMFFALFSLVFAIIGLYTYSYIFNKSKTPEKYRNLNDPMQQHIGDVATLDEDIKDNRGKIKVGDTMWSVYSKTNFSKGDKVKIVGIKDNMIFIVEKAD